MFNWVVLACLVLFKWPWPNPKPKAGLIGGRSSSPLIGGVSAGQIRWFSSGTLWLGLDHCNLLTPSCSSHSSLPTTIDLCSTVAFTKQPLLCQGFHGPYRSVRPHFTGPGHTKALLSLMFSGPKKTGPVLELDRSSRCSSWKVAVRTLRPQDLAESLREGGITTVPRLPSSGALRDLETMGRRSSFFLSQEGTSECPVVLSVLWVSCLQHFGVSESKGSVEFVRKNAFEGLWSLLPQRTF